MCLPFATTLNGTTLSRVISHQQTHSTTTNNNYNYTLSTDYRRPYRHPRDDSDRRVLLWLRERLFDAISGESQAMEHSEAAY